MAEFAFAVDATPLINELNTKLQGKGHFVHEMHSLVKAFMRKLQFPLSQLENNTLILSISPNPERSHTISLSPPQVLIHVRSTASLHCEF